MARLTGQKGINQLKGNTYFGRFVLNELLQLVIAPIGNHPISVLIPSFSLCANVLQPFHANNSAIVPFGIRDKFLGNNVVIVSGKSFLFSRESFKNFFSSSCTFRLEACSNLVLFGFIFRNLISTKRKIVTGVSNIRNPSVNAHWFCSGGFFDKSFLNSYMYIPVVSVLNNFSMSRFLPSKLGSLEIGKNKCYTNSFVKSFNRYRPVLLTEGKSTSVIINRLRKKFSRCFSFLFKIGESRGNTPDRTHRKVSGKRKFLFNFIVAKLMQINCVRDFFFLSDFKNIVTGVRKNTTSFKKNIASFFRIKEFTNNCAFNHAYRLTLINKKEEQNFLLSLNGWVSILSKKG